MDIKKLNQLASACLADSSLFQLAKDAKTHMQTTLADTVSMEEAFAIARDRLPDTVITKAINIANNYYRMTLPKTEQCRYIVALSIGNILKQLGNSYYATSQGIGELMDKIDF